MSKVVRKSRTRKKRKVLKGSSFAGTSFGGRPSGRPKARGMRNLRKRVSSNPKIKRQLKKTRDKKFGQSTTNIGNRVASKAETVKKGFASKVSKFKGIPKKKPTFSKPRKKRTR